MKQILAAIENLWQGIIFPVLPPYLSNFSLIKLHFSAKTLMVPITLPYQ